MAQSNRRSRNRSHGGHGHDERWLLPYSDMITLLLALFIVLYSMANVNTSKVKVLQESLGKAFNGEMPVPQASPPAKSSSPLQGQGESLLNAGVNVTDVTRAMKQAQQRAAELESLKAIKRRIDRYAHDRHIDDRVSTRIEERGLVVRLVTDKVLFDTGKAQLRDDARPLLRRINSLVGPVPNPIRVEGHTDSVPIRTAQFPSNWELSTVRAASVVRFMISRGRNPDRLSASGYGDRKPIASNKSTQGRGRNRRVEIVIVRRRA